MKIAITGATGFVGAQLVRHFAKAGHQIIAIGRTEHPPTKLTQQAAYMRADINDPLPAIDCDVCIHTAGLADDRAGRDALMRVNCVGTQHVFEACAGAKVFIHISSASVYATGDVLHKEADEPALEALSWYGQSKRRAEQYLLRENKTRPWQGLFILRPRAIYGVGDRVLLPRILKLKKGNWLPVPGDLRVRASLTHIRNLIHAVDCCLQMKVQKAEIYNVCDDQVYELRRVVQQLMEARYGSCPRMLR
ncbi:MAG: NAD(P)-dependent oxidoreductase, partial [Bacteroidota bacterium]